MQNAFTIMKKEPVIELNSTKLFNEKLVQYKENEIITLYLVTSEGE
jgi:hypothetical protein